ncbi:hypothetical protein R1sor_022752 [Riccia sorocarpa]|uniref:Uncharacterized protein n=1 Tax=Riccia sorocarpa TaxID=122646 RepID=A0ABD3GPM2_9MARC
MVSTERPSLPKFHFFASQQIHMTNMKLRLLDLVQRHRAVTNPVMATKKLVIRDACRRLDAPATAAAGAEAGASIAVATPRLEMTTAAIITLAAVDFMVDAIPLVDGGVRRPSSKQGVGRNPVKELEESLKL